MATAGVLDAEIRDAEGFAVPFGKPPAARRGSLPNVARKRKEKISRAHLKLPLSNSMTNLTPTKKKEGAVLETLKTRAVSASNLAALSDSNLSIKEALPPRSYDKPNTEGNVAKIIFEESVKTYFYQMTEGCGNDNCKNKFCKSSKDGKKFDLATALVYSVELASTNRPFMCAKDRFKGRVIPDSILKGDDAQEPKPFMQVLLSTTPFDSLFKTPKQLESGKPTVQPYDLPKFDASTLYQTSSNVRYQDLLPRDMIKQRAKDSVLLNSYSLTNLSNAGKTIVSKTGKLIKQSISSSFGNVFRGEKEDLSNQSSLDSLGSGDFGLPGSPCSNLGSLSPKNSSPMQVYGSNEDLAHAHAQLDEFERQLSLEMTVGDSNEFSLTHLTLPMLEAAAQKYEETSDSSFLLNTVRTVCTSPASVNKSFLINDQKEASPTNLNLKAVREAFTLLMTLAPFDQFHSVLSNSIDILLTTLVQQGMGYIGINPILILLECPLFRKRRNHELRQKLCKVIANLGEMGRVSLVRALSTYDSEIFERRIMGIYKDHFMLSLKPNQRTNADLIDIAQTLAVFFEANLFAAETCGKPLIPSKLFYVTELSRKLDYRAEYELWYSRGEGSDQTPTKLCLLDFPFIMDPSSKVHVLHLDAVVQMRKEYQEAILHQARVNQVLKYLREVNRKPNLTDSVKSAMCPYLVLNVRRENLLEDAINEIKLKAVDLKKPLKIKYVGGGEQGLDMGGLQKEFFHLICQKVFDPAYGMFAYSEETRSLWFKSSETDNEDEFEMVGIVLGLALYNGVILDVRFPNALYKKLQALPLSLADLMDADPALGHGLMELLNYEGDDIEDVFCQSFQVSVQSYDLTTEVDLVPNGADIPVTQKNKHHFVRRYVDYLLTESIAKQFEAFSRGFHSVCRKESLALFSPDEIELLVCGSTELDFEALEKSAAYDDGYYVSHRTVRAFWEVVHQMTQDQKRQLLHFITGSDRVPLKGLSHLPIVIQRNGGDCDRLPTAMTCFNRLLLPSYATKEKLQSKLMVAIEHGKGFGLT